MEMIRELQGLKVAIQLAEETMHVNLFKTVCSALNTEKSILENKLKADKEKENEFKEQLEEVKKVLAIFEEIIK